jgi:hypothetical protein
MASQFTSQLPFRLARYKQQVSLWPTAGRHILASHDTSTVIVYQAFCNSIADAIIKTNNFHSDEVIRSGYSFTRMTWIKTNFLWMMYRSGWASKPSQERILAIQITRNGFEEILRNASTHGPGCVRLQWDPDHSPNGEKAHDRRAIQLGLRGEMLNKFSSEFVVGINDITDFVKAQVKNMGTEAFDDLEVPVETVYACSEEAAKVITVDRL